MTYLIHFTNNSFNFWLRISQKLEERGDSWEELSTLLLPCSNVRDLSAIMRLSLQVFKLPNLLFRRPYFENTRYTIES
jgi:hypothetical protein